MLSTKNVIDSTYSKEVKNINYDVDLLFLVKEYYKTDSPNILERIIECSQKMILDSCLKAKDKLNSCNLDIMDLVQECNLQLMRVLKNKRYDYNKYQPSTYFITCFNNAITQVLTDNSSPFTMTSHMNKKVQAVRQYNNDIKEGISEKKALRKNKLSKEDVKNYQPKNSISIYSEVGNETETDVQPKIIDFIEDTETNTEKYVEESCLKQLIKDNLSELEYNIFIDKYETELTSAEIAHKYNKEIVEVNYILNVCKNKLRHVEALRSYVS